MARKLVLVIDDDEKFRAFAARDLRAAGYDVGWAPQSAEALRTINSRRPKVVLLDVRDPEGGGAGFLEELTKNKQLATTPVVLVSENIEKLVQHSLIQHAIKKPCSKEELLRAVETNLEKKEPSLAMLDVDIAFDEELSAAQLGGAPNDRWELFANVRNGIHNRVAAAIEARLVDLLAEPDQKAMWSIIEEILNSSLDDEFLDGLVSTVEKAISTKLTAAPPKKP